MFDGSRVPPGRLAGPSRPGSALRGPPDPVGMPGKGPGVRSVRPVDRGGRMSRGARIAWRGSWAILEGVGRDRVWMAGGWRRIGGNRAGRVPGGATGPVGRPDPHPAGVPGVTPRNGKNRTLTPGEGVAKNP